MISTKKIGLAFLTFIGFITVVMAQQGVVNIEQDEAIVKLLEYKKDIKTKTIYKIQVAQSADPDIAKGRRNGFLNSFAQWPVEIHWDTPNYKIWVGNFTTRLEADRALAKIKKRYTHAFILEPKTD